MLQNPFYEGMQRKEEAILEGHLKKAHHLGHLDNIGGQHVGTPNMNAKRGPIPSCKDLPKQRFNPARAHDHGIMYNHP